MQGHRPIYTKQNKKGKPGSDKKYSRTCTTKTNNALSIYNFTIRESWRNEKRAERLRDM